MGITAAAAVMARIGDAGRKSTHARARVVAATLRRRSPFTAEEVVREVARSGVGRATVFRTLDLLVSIGALSRVIESCRGISRKNSRRSTVTPRSMKGISRIRPGPRVAWRLPSLNTTRRWYSGTIRIACSSEFQPIRQFGERFLEALSIPFSADVAVEAEAPPTMDAKVNAETGPFLPRSTVSRIRALRSVASNARYFTGRPSLIGTGILAARLR